MGNRFNVPVKASGTTSMYTMEAPSAQSVQCMASFSVRSSECYIYSPGTSESYMGSPRSEGEILSTPNFQLQVFSFTELKKATRNFRPDCLLGEGGFGCVFKGWIGEQGMVPTNLGSGIVVAVKKLNREGLQGHREWLAEVTYLSQIHHPNVVKLIGYCAEDDQRLLVYEFMQGSLDNHLFKRGSHPLSWAIRIKVAVDTARALAFLHNAERPIIHRDIKASNIMLDWNYNSKLSDFGIANDGPTGDNTYVDTDVIGNYISKLSGFGLARDSPSGDNTHVSTRVMGTYGYAAPEYMATGRLTAKSDVYSFGVVLLELLSGRRVIENNKPCIEKNLVEWAKPYLSDKRKLFRVMDTRLEGQYNMKRAHKAANLALQCLSSEAKLRPLMTQVVETLEQLQNVEELA